MIGEFVNRKETALGFLAGRPGHSPSSPTIEVKDGTFWPYQPLFSGLQSPRAVRSGPVGDSRGRQEENKLSLSKGLSGAQTYNQRGFCEYDSHRLRSIIVPRIVDQILFDKVINES